MFTPDGDFDWVYYHTDLTKAKADRFKWFIFGIIIGLVTATGGFVLLVQYLQSLP